MLRELIPSMIPSMITFAAIGLAVLMRRSVKVGPVEIGSNSTVAVTDTANAVVRPDGAEKPVGRQLHGVQFDQDRNLTLTFDGYTMLITGTIQEVTVNETV